MGSNGNFHAHLNKELTRGSQFFPLASVTLLLCLLRSSFFGKEPKEGLPNLWLPEAVFQLFQRNLEWTWTCEQIYSFCR